MRKLIAILTILTLILGLAGAQAESADNNFLISDWSLIYTYDGTIYAEQTLFIYEDGTFEVMDENESKKGTWTFDGEKLVLTLDDIPLELKWNKEADQLDGTYSGMDVTMVRPIEPETPEGGMITGGWAVAEDPAITDEIKNIFYQALDSYPTGTITVSYTPVALLGSQVVAGTNYAVLCRSQEINKEPVLVILYIYADLEGNTSVLKEEPVTLGI